MKILAAGELLVDLAAVGKTELGGINYVANCGGAPANAMAMAAKLGVDTALCAVVGNDDLGRFLVSKIREAGVGVEHIRLVDEADTTLAFVNIDETGERSFTFFRRPGADTLLDSRYLSDNILKDTAVYHFSGVSLSRDPARTSVLSLAAKAKREHVLVSFDPNYRPAIMTDVEVARKLYLEAMTCVDILKVSEEEAMLITQTQDLDAAVAALQGLHRGLCLITRGDKGAIAVLGSKVIKKPSLQVKAIDTTGAGDAFFGAVLAFLCMNNITNLNNLDADGLDALLTIGCRAGSLTTTRLGAIPALPTKEEIGL